MARTNGTTKALTFENLGSGIKMADDGSTLHLQIDYSDKRIEDAPLSKTGKMKLIGNTGGWTRIGDKLKMNLQCGISVAELT